MQEPPWVFPVGLGAAITLLFLALMLFVEIGAFDDTPWIVQIVGPLSHKIFGHFF